MLFTENRYMVDRNEERKIEVIFLYGISGNNPWSLGVSLADRHYSFNGQNGPNHFFKQTL